MKKLIFLLSIITLLGSCESEQYDEPFVNQEVSEPFDGAWSFKIRSCECEPVVLNNGDNVWTFNSTSNLLHIDNNMSSLFPYLDSTGTYEITYTEDSIYFDQFGYLYYLENENLFLADYPEADGPLIEFECLSPIPNNNCDILLNGLLDRNDALLSMEIDNLCVDLEPNPSFSDLLGHQVNLLSLVNRLNANCPDIICSISCYACIETEPLTSEILFQLDSMGTQVERVVDIASPSDDILNYLSIH